MDRLKLAAISVAEEADSMIKYYDNYGGEILLERLRSSLEEYRKAKTGEPIDENHIRSNRS